MNKLIINVSTKNNTKEFGNLNNGDIFTMPNSNGGDKVFYMLIVNGSNERVALSLKSFYSSYIGDNTPCKVYDATLNLSESNNVT